MKNDPGRIAYIDGLRGIAVLSVVLFHVGVYNAAAIGKLAPAIGIALRDGAHGVDLFFVLSGFCLAYPALARLHAEGQTGFRVSAFAARRLVRIVPPYYAAIGVLLLAGTALLFLRRSLPTSMAPEALTLRAIFEQMTFTGHTYLASSFWTLAVEFRWYFVFPLVLWLWTISRPAFALVALSALVVAETRFHIADLFFLPVFMLGIVAADIQIRGGRIARLAPLLLPVLLVLAVATTLRAGWYFYDVGPFWGIAMFGLVVAAGSSALARRVLSHKWLVFVGVTSYGIYLVHEPAIEMIRRMFPAATPFGALFACVTVGAVAAGIVFSLCAEQPFVRSAMRERMVRFIESHLGLLVRACRTAARIARRRGAGGLKLKAQER